MAAAINSQKILGKENAMMQKKNKIKSPVAQDLQAIELPRPRLDHDTSVLRALQKRKTVREISDRRISLQTLSNLLWAACGINRKIGPFGVPGRTAASSSNSQEIDIYVITEEGMYLYDAFHLVLIPAVVGDHRALAIGPSQASIIAKAPVQLIYIVDVHKLSKTSGYQEPGLQDPEIQKSYYYVDTGLIAGNVYLFAASQGLASWFHNCNKSGLTSILNLRSDQRVLFSQTVGYPARK